MTKSWGESKNESKGEVDAALQATGDGFKTFVVYLSVAGVVKQAVRFIVCYTAVFSVVTQRSSQFVGRNIA